MALNTKLQSPLKVPVQTAKALTAKFSDWVILQSKHHVFNFDEVSGKDLNLVGIKGANICEMARLNLPIPPGFIMSTDTCKEFFEHLEKKKRITKQVRKAIHGIEKRTGKVFGMTEVNTEEGKVQPGQPDHCSKGMHKWPLLLSIRPSTPESMPGMLNSVLNVGINDEIVEIMAALSGNAHWAYDTYRLFIQLYGATVMRVDRKVYEAVLAKKRAERGLAREADFSVEDLKALIGDFKQIAPIHQDPWQQLINTLFAVVYSWYTPRAIQYREMHSLRSELGTAVVVQAMVYGNMNAASGAGIALSRNPATGAREYFGEYLEQDAGISVVTGLKNPAPLARMREAHLNTYDELLHALDTLEKHFKEALNVEFVVENDALFIVQCRKAKLTATAALHIAVGLVQERMITEREALMRLDPNEMSLFLQPRIDPDIVDEKKTQDAIIGHGQAASAGAASGVLVFNAATAASCIAAGQDYIYCKEDNSLEDFEALKGAAGLLTLHGGLTSHTAVLMRTLNIPAVTAVRDLCLRANGEEQRVLAVNGANGAAEQEEGDGKKQKKHEVNMRAGQTVTIDGTTGIVYKGPIATVAAGQDAYFNTLLHWADKYRHMEVRATVTSEEDLLRAKQFAGSGIGCLHTEYLFAAPGCKELFQQVILSSDAKTRQTHLAELAGLHREALANMFHLMNDGVVKIRLLHAPLACFLPHPQDNSFGPDVDRLAELVGLSAEECRARIAELQEDSPLLGLRGGRLAVVYPDIIGMQVRAIAGAVFDAKKQGTPVLPSILLPQAYGHHELEYLIPGITNLLTALCDEVVQSMRFLNISLKFLNIGIGALVELPRAAMRVEKIAAVEGLDFVSFDSDALTEMIFGAGEQESRSFFPTYVSSHIKPRDAFETLDIHGVAVLMRSAVQALQHASAANGKKVTMDVLGSHCSDAASVRLLAHMGFHSLSCAPYRIPIAKIAAAQAQIQAETEKAHKRAAEEDDTSFWSFLTHLPTIYPKTSRKQRTTVEHQPLRIKQ